MGRTLARFSGRLGARREPLLSGIRRALPHLRRLGAGQVSNSQPRRRTSVAAERPQRGRQAARGGRRGGERGDALCGRRNAAPGPGFHENGCGARAGRRRAGWVRPRRRSRAEEPHQVDVGIGRRAARHRVDQDQQVRRRGLQVDEAPCAPALDLRPGGQRGLVGGRRRGQANRAQVHAVACRSWRAARPARRGRDAGHEAGGRLAGLLRPEAHGLNLCPAQISSAARKISGAVNTSARRFAAT
jgi:hypothetical protein